MDIDYKQIMSKCNLTSVELRADKARECDDISDITCQQG